MEYIYLILSLIAIIVAAHIVVDSASSLAIRCKIPKIIIALTIVSFGNCTPELAVSFNAVASGNGSIALANIIGSCVVNITLIIGIVAIVRPIKVNIPSIQKQVSVLFWITLWFAFILTFRMLSSSSFSYIHRIDGILLVLLFSIFIYNIVKIIKKRNKEDDLHQDKPKYGTIKSLIYLILSLAVISFGSYMLVDSAVVIAENLNISQKLIAMCVISMGAALPDLITAIIAARKNENEIALGNIIGANVLSICIVLGLPIATLGSINIVGFGIIDILVVLMVSFLLFIFVRSKHDISKYEGMILVLMFIIYFGYIWLI